MPTLAVPTNKAIMDVAAELPSFLKFNLHQLNLVCIYLGTYFFSNLVWPNSSRVIDCYIAGDRDRWSISKYSWPRVSPLPEAFKVWRKFIALVTSSDQTLLSPINSTRAASCYQVSIYSISADYSYLTLSLPYSDEQFHLTQSRRDNFECIPVSQSITTKAIPV